VVGSQGYLTIKGVQSTGMTRAEYEYPIPVTDAETILQTLCQPPLIEKFVIVSSHRKCHLGSR
jgi:CYTH domain-containing protein